MVSCDDYDATSEVPIESLGPLSLDELQSLRLYWRAANYLSLGQTYLKSNPFLERSLAVSDLKEGAFENWGTIAGINLVYAHLNRMITRTGKDLILIAGPGHGCSALIANTYLEGTYSERNPDVPQNRDGVTRLFADFSYQSYANGCAAIPGTIQAGYELGHCLSHAYGAVLDAPDLICCCIVGDGEAETGALSSAWLSNLQLNPAIDGVVLPVVHLNGYKIAAPSLFSKLRDDDLEALFKGLGYRPYFVEGSDPECVHQFMAKALDRSFEDIAKIKQAGDSSRIIYPMIILKTPQGWTGPKIFEGQMLEGTAVNPKMRKFNPREDNEHLKLLERWFHSYNIRKIFDRQGKLPDKQRMWIPKGSLRLGDRNETNGGNRKEMILPPLEKYFVEVAAENDDRKVVAVISDFLRDVIGLNRKEFRIFSSDGTNSSEHLTSIFEVTNRVIDEEPEREDAQANPARIMELLSQQTCAGWLEGYILTGRHGVYVCSEHFSNTFVSMLCQSAYWLGASKKVHWRKSLSALNYLLLSSLWSNESKNPVQHPGFISAVLGQSENVTTVWLPPDANCAVVVMETCLRSVDSINLIIANVHCQERWLDGPEAVRHCRDGISIWDWAGNTDEVSPPDLIMACAGMIATRETIKTAKRLTVACPDLKIRVVNVLNLNKLRDQREEHPDCLSAEESARFFPQGIPVVMAYDGFSSEIYSLIGRRSDAGRWSVHGYDTERSLAQRAGPPADDGSFHHLAGTAISKIDKPIAGLEQLKNELQNSL